MVIDLGKLNLLKQQLITATDFREPLNYFFDHISTNQAVIEKSEQTQHPLIEQVIEKVGQQLFGNQAKVHHILLSELKEYGLLHGTCLIDHHVVNIVFFSDIDIGLLAITMEQDKVLTARFSSTTLSAASDKAFYVPNVSNAIH